MYFGLSMGDKLTTIELGKAVGLTHNRINQMIKDGEIKAEKLGRDWIIDKKYIDIIRNRPERRGRKKGQVSYRKREIAA